MVTLVSSSPVLPSRLAALTLPCELSDAITEAVTAPPDPHTRSEVVCSLIREIYDAAAWIHGVHNPPDEELTSLRRLLVEADAHHERMRSACGCGDPGA